MQLMEAKKRGLHSWLCEVELYSGRKMKSLRAFIILKLLEELGCVITTCPNPYEVIGGEEIFAKIAYLIATPLDLVTLQTCLKENIDVQTVKLSPFLD